MDNVVIAITIVAFVSAVIIAGITLTLQIMTYRASTDHLQKVEANVATAVTMVGTLVAELKGQTAQMADAQQKQFNTMLEAFVTRPATANEAAEKATESSAAMTEIVARMDDLEKSIAEKPDTSAIQLELADIKQEIHFAASGMSTAAHLAREVSRSPSVGVGMNQYHVEGLGSFPVDVVELLRLVASGEERGTPVTVRQALGMKPGVYASPSYAIEDAQRRELLTSSFTGGDGTARMEATLALTEKGSELLQILRNTAEERRNSDFGLP